MSYACPKGHKRIILIEYDLTHPAHYDGISEIKCFTCKKRYGKWSGKVLRGKQYEKPYGGK